MKEQIKKSKVSSFLGNHVDSGSKRCENEFFLFLSNDFAKKIWAGGLQR